MRDGSEVHKTHALHVCFFGDSICFGQGVAIHKGWVTRLSASLSKVGASYGREVIVINASVNGNTTRQALERMPYDVQSHGIDLMIVQFGLNDCNHWESDKGHPRVSPKAFEANLEEIVRRGITFGAKRIFLNTNHPTGRDKDPVTFSDMTYEAHNRHYNEIIRRVARTDDRISLNDVEKAFKRSIETNGGSVSSFLLPDLLHLNEAGHDLYFEIIATSLLNSVGHILESHAKI